MTKPAPKSPRSAETADPAQRHNAEGQGCGREQQHPVLTADGDPADQPHPAEDHARRRADPGGPAAPHWRSAWFWGAAIGVLGGCMLVVAVPLLGAAVGARVRPGWGQPRGPREDSRGESRR